MKKLIALVMTFSVIFGLAACGSRNSGTNETSSSGSNISGTNETASSGSSTSGTDESSSSESNTQIEDVVDSVSEENEKHVASDGAQMQTEDSSMPTRVLEEGTHINMYFGETLIPGILNDSTTAQEFIKMLPLTVHESKYSHDFCGSLGVELPFDKEDERYGWLNGDIAIGTDVPWFTILFDDEEISEQFGNLVNIGVINCPLSEISSLDGSYDVRIELAE